MSLLKNFINGQLVDSSGTTSVDVTNPATEEIICKVPLSTAADVDAAVQVAKAVFPEWSGITIKQVPIMCILFVNSIDLFRNILDAESGYHVSFSFFS